MHCASFDAADIGRMGMPDLASLWLTARLAFVTTLVLLIIGTPLAWWLAQTRSRFKPAIEAIVALPLVLPPTRARLLSVDCDEPE